MLSIRAIICLLHIGTIAAIRSLPRQVTLFPYLFSSLATGRSIRWFNICFTLYSGRSVTSTGSPGPYSAPRIRNALFASYCTTYATALEKNAPRSAPTTLLANAISPSMRTVSRPSHGIGMR